MGMMYFDDDYLRSASILRRQYFQRLDAASTQHAFTISLAMFYAATLPP